MRSEVPAIILGNFLKFIQATIDAIGYALEGTDKSRGPIPLHNIMKTQLSVTRTFAGSFGVELSSLQGADLFGNTPTGDAIERFISLLNVGCDADKLKEIFSSLQIRPAAKYRELLNHVLRYKTSFNIEWASPVENRRGYAELSVKTAQEAISIIDEIESEEPYEYDINGILVGMNIRTRVYEIRDIEENRKLSGKILDEAMDQAEHATINKQYLARIREEAELIPATGEMKYNKQLVSLVEPE